VTQRIVVAEALADGAVDALRAVCEVDVLVGADRDTLIEALGDAVAVVVRSGTQVDEEMIAAAPKLEVIGRAGVGLDNIDVEAAAARGITVVNAPDASTISAAEHTMALLLAQARRIPEADASLRAGRWDRKALEGVELSGKTLGLIGLGRIGSQVAELAKAFGMRVLAYDPLISPDRAAALGVALTSFDDVLSEADFLSIHAPRTVDTEQLIDAAALARMKPSARIVNVARGGIVDEAALAEAVGDGTIAGAAIDVFAIEPTTESPLFDHPQIVVTPHLGASTAEAQVRAGTSTVEAVLAALDAATGAR
jgi:D-3-phosphoglycerate dehydrogenase / 2-oxoglutarate reductase